ncbi:FOXJ1 protein, partial [Phainopepla nitens]|nr:FOXJ1 protein [Phainopepla nitens]
FQCAGFPLSAEELCHYIDIPRASSCPSAVPVPRAPAWPPPLPGDLGYEGSAHGKPPYSYATLICMALEASKEPKLTLAAICKWISDNFSYFRRADPAWQSSIRHNLCINKRFVKVPREKGEPGRGAFWKLHPQYAEWLKSSTPKGRGTPPEPVPAVPSRRARRGARRAPSPGRACGSRGSLQVGAELQRLLREFEEFESSHEWHPAESPAGQPCRQPRPTPPAEASWLPGCAAGAPEEPGELTELGGSSGWEALFSVPKEQGDLAVGQLQLPPASQPGGAFPLSPSRPRGQQQGSPKPSPTERGLDETLMATAFLEHQEARESLSSCVPVEQGAENIQVFL